MRNRFLSYFIEAPYKTDKSHFVYFVFVGLLSLYGANLLSSLPVEAFYDRENYVNYVLYAPIHFQELKDMGFLKALFNEPLWILLNYGLSLHLDTDEVIRCYVFFAFLVTSTLVLYKHPKQFLLVALFLLLPQIIKDYVVHLRQGVGLSLFLIGWYSTRKDIKWLFFLAAPLMHSSFFFIDLLMVTQILISWVGLNLFIRFVVYVAFVVALEVLGIWLADLFGARQGDRYSQSYAQTSGGGFVLWLAVLFIFFAQGRIFIKRNILSISVLIFYLFGYFILPPVARIFESGLMIILTSSLQLTGPRKFAFLLIFLFYFGAQWYVRFKMPLYGWAA